MALKRCLSAMVRVLVSMTMRTGWPQAAISVATALAASALGRLVMIVEAPDATARAPSAMVTPASASALRRDGSVSNPMTSQPRSTRLRAIALPMMPRPMMPTFRSATLPPDPPPHWNAGTPYRAEWVKVKRCNCERQWNLPRERAPVESNVLNALVARLQQALIMIDLFPWRQSGGRPVQAQTIRTL